MTGRSNNVPAAEPCYSIRLMRPFLGLMAKNPTISSELMKRLAELPDDARVPVRSVLHWLDLAVQITKDPDVGLRAAARADSATGDVLNFAARSAATLGEALALVLRYVRLLNEAAEFSMTVRDGVVAVELHSRVPLTRPAADFQMGTLVRGTRDWLGHLDGFEIWFAHAAPADLKLYEQIFAPARLRFGAPYDAMIFDATLLDAKLRSADQALNKVLLRHADQLVSTLPQDDALAPKVRKLLLELLPSGNSDATRVASKLGMSRRTLTRHLEKEGVTYKQLLEKARHQLALQYLEKTNLDPQQIAFMLGYSVTAAFSRAFSRWEGKSPTEHRRNHRARSR